MRDEFDNLFQKIYEAVKKELESHNVEEFVLAIAIVTKEELKKVGTSIEKEKTVRIYAKAKGEHFKVEDRKIWKQSETRKVLKVETQSDEAKVIRLGKEDVIILL